VKLSIAFSKNLLAVFLAIPLIGCPYRLVREDSSRLPAGIRTLSVPLAKNHTIEAGLEDIFTNELIRRLAADSRVEVVEHGEAELGCELVELKVSAASYTREGKIASETLSLKARCDLVLADSGSVAWRSGPLYVREEYPVGGDYLMNERARETALGEAARDMSESVRSLLLDDAW